MTQTNDVIIPLEDRVLIRPADPELKKGALFIPENAAPRPIEGTVVAVGPGRVTSDGVFVKTTLNIGDRVIFAKYGGTTIDRHGEIVLIKECDVLAKLMPNPMIDDEAE